MSFSTPAARTIAVGVLTLVTSLGLTGCGSDTSSTSTEDPSRTRPRRSSTSPSRATRSRPPTSGSR